MRPTFMRSARLALVARHHPQNDDSRRVLERLGFRRIGEEYYAPTGLTHWTYRLENLPACGGVPCRT